MTASVVVVSLESNAVKPEFDIAMRIDCQHFYTHDVRKKSLGKTFCPVMLPPTYPHLRKSWHFGVE